MTEVVIYAAGIICALILAWIYILSRKAETTENKVLRTFLITWFLVMLIFIPKAVVDEKIVQFPVVNKSIDLNNSATRYYYGVHEVADPNQTTTLFYTVMLWFAGVLAFIYIVYMWWIIWDLMKGIMKKAKLGGRRLF